MKPLIKNYLLASLAFILVAAGVAFAQAPDPGTPGPLAVTREEYNFGDTAFQPTDFPGPVELRASIHYPTNLAAGPFQVPWGSMVFVGERSGWLSFLSR